MSLSCACPCGTRFEVEDTFAGQTIACPECQQPMQAPTQQRRPLRTSGFAVASVVSALVLAFTGVGSVLAVILGTVALIQISRHRDQVTGTGYALFGIISGLAFTVLFVLAIARTELFGFDLVRESMMRDRVETGGPLEVSRPDDGFTIRRPTTKWAVAKHALADELAPGSDLVLVHLAKDAYIDVSEDSLDGRTLDAYRDVVLDTLKDNRVLATTHRKPTLPLHRMTVHSSQKLPLASDREVLEVLLDGYMGAQHLTYLIRIVRATNSDTVYLICGWAKQKRFPGVEPEMRMALDSFRVLKP